MRESRGHLVKPLEEAPVLGGRRGEMGDDLYWPVRSTRQASWFRGRRGAYWGWGARPMTWKVAAWETASIMAKISEASGNEQGERVA